jgi:hypothetical protein
MPVYQTAVKSNFCEVSERQRNGKTGIRVARGGKEYGNEKQRDSEAAR